MREGIMKPIALGPDGADRMSAAANNRANS
jgi:hypothetical protein